MPIKTTLTNCTNPWDCLEAAWEAPERNAPGSSYMAGMIDGLMWAGNLTEAQYNLAYDLFVYGEPRDCPDQ